MHWKFNSDHGGQGVGVGGNIANLLFMFFIASCSVIGHVGHPRVVGRRDRAGCQALGGGAGHLIVHHTLFLFWDQFVFSSVFICWLLYGEILSGA